MVCAQTVIVPAMSRNAVIKNKIFFIHFSLFANKYTKMGVRLQVPLSGVRVRECQASAHLAAG
jgi:hypothetical protein